MDRFQLVQHPLEAFIAARARPSALDAKAVSLSDGMEVPEELATRFKFAKQRSKLAGTIRGSFFVVKGEY